LEATKIPTNDMKVATNNGIFLEAAGVSIFSAPVQKIYRPNRARTFTNCIDSKNRLNTWHNKRGAIEYETNLKETVKFLPSSRGKVISLRINEVPYTVI